MIIPDYATYRGILNDFPKQFDDLRQIVAGVEKYFWPKSTEQYTGPIDPTGIVFTYGTRKDKNTGELLDNSRTWLVLAENVPPEFVDPEASGPMMVLTRLDGHFNLQAYDHSSKTITEVLNDYAATIEKWCQRDPYVFAIWNAKLSMQEKLQWRDDNF